MPSQRSVPAIALLLIALSGCFSPSGPNRCATDWHVPPSPPGTIVGWGSMVVGEQAALQDLVAIAGGALFSLALDSDGSIVGWGKDDFGQCDVPSPNACFRAVAAGELHGLGIKADGSIVAWGHNYDGQCSVPEPNEDFICAQGGSGYSVGLKADGTILAWGRNDKNQCEVPEPNSGFSAISAGLSNHSLGLRGGAPISVEKL